jgi:histidinol-phosphate/aromatic aminotransferase/cobyric acid decarboxylase-like protein
VELIPGSHGGDGARLALALDVDPATILDLSASLNPCAPDIEDLASRHLDSLRSYPDESRARAALAEVLEVDPQRLVLTNGAAEAIGLVAAQKPIGWVDEPEFSLYRRHLHSVQPDAPRWQSDPHNPTGLLADPLDRAEVRDEAFYPLATGRWTRGDESAVTIGSLTKLFACPGLRMGFVVSPDEELAASISASRPVWSVGALATALIPELVETALLQEWATAIDSLRADLIALLTEHELKPEPSAANYLWIPESCGLRERLLPTGILVRSGSSFGYPDAARIAVTDDSGLERLSAALDLSA